MGCIIIYKWTFGGLSLPFGRTSNMMQAPAVFTGVTAPIASQDGVACTDVIADPREMAQFRAQAKEQYDVLFHEMEFRALRAALMHYHDASSYNRNCYYLEVAAAVIGAASISGLGALLLKWNSGGLAAFTRTTSTTATKVGLLGLLGVVVSALLEFVSKGSSGLVPTFGKRGDAHKLAAAGWQRLTRLARSRRIQLQSPAADVSDYQTWYEELVGMRQEVSEIAMVAKATHRAFNDAGRVYVFTKRKQAMFLCYKEMCKGDLEVKENYEDDD